MTGVGFSTAVAAWVRGTLVVLWVVAVVVAARPVLRRRASSGIFVRNNRPLNPQRP
jgi:hypothetical protein